MFYRTIFGGSAGAVAVCYHMASPHSQGLFAGAIMQSGNCYTTHTLQASFEQGNLVLNVS